MDLAKIFNKFIPEYIQKFGENIPQNHLKTIRDIMQCRTSDLGGEVYFCESCGKHHYSYHSCKNRHCPKCGSKDAENWLEKQKDKLLPVEYFMVTFTIPEELRSIARSNQKVFYNALFKASSSALQKMLKDIKYAGGDAGFTGILHTWTRQLHYHPHIHFIVPGGAYDFKRNKWNTANHKFLIPVKALSKIYRKKFQAILRKKEPKLYQKIKEHIWYEKEFISNSISVGKGDQAFTYLANYVYKTAITNNRIIRCENGHVTFKYKNSDTGKEEFCTVKNMEFIRRFLQHTLPQRFQKIRHYGFLSAVAKQKWEKIKAKFGVKKLKVTNKSDEKPKTVYCAHCKEKMIIKKTILRNPRSPPSRFLNNYVKNFSKTEN